MRSCHAQTRNWVAAQAAPERRQSHFWVSDLALSPAFCRNWSSFVPIGDLKSKYTVTKGGARNKQTTKRRRRARGSGCAKRPPKKGAWRVSRPFLPKSWPPGCADDTTHRQDNTQTRQHTDKTTHRQDNTPTTQTTQTTHRQDKTTHRQQHNAQTTRCTKNATHRKHNTQTTQSTDNTTHRQQDAQRNAQKTQRTDNTTHRQNTTQHTDTRTNTRAQVTSWVLTWPIFNAIAESGQRH